MSSKNAPDLTQRPPRSPRVRLGGYAILPRMLDKGRAMLIGKEGEYKFDCPLDGYFLDFVGLKGSDIKALLEKGLGDGEILQWVETNATTKRRPEEIRAWAAYHEMRAPMGTEAREFFNSLHVGAGPAREDISSWFDLLDLDDHVSFGGKA